MATGLAAIGARVEETADGLVIDGNGGDPLAGGETIAGHLDHRICMSFAIAGLVSKAPVEIDDMAPVGTSLPNFATLLERWQRGCCRSSDERGVGHAWVRKVRNRWATYNLK